MNTLDQMFSRINELRVALGEQEFDWYELRRCDGMRVRVKFCIAHSSQFVASDATSYEGAVCDQMVTFERQLVELERKLAAKLENIRALLSSAQIPSCEELLEATR